jgi:predicted component of type VI protein secretion system
MMSSLKRSKQMTQTLKSLHQIEAKAWRAMMNGSDVDARTVYGEEGKNYLVWCKAADACRAYREQHGLVGA